MTTSSSTSGFLGHDYLVDLAIEHMTISLGYTFIDVLGKGSYGSVVEVMNREHQYIAAKIVKRRLVNEYEIKVWPKLKHKNVLKLLDVIIDVDGVVIFLTDRMEMNLFVRLHCREFKEDEKAGERCIKYSRQVFAGMSYLHHQELCHLDLRAENVFLDSRDDRAVVGDFTGLTLARNEKSYCPLPRNLCPPELLRSKKRPVAPLPVDLWSCGLLLASIFLGNDFYRSTAKHKRADPMATVREFKANFRSEPYVSKCVRETYPYSAFNKSAIKNFVNLVGGFLREKPRRRIKVDDALRHPFLTTPHSSEPISVPEEAHQTSSKPDVEESSQKKDLGLGSEERWPEYMPERSDDTNSADSIQNKTQGRSPTKPSKLAKLRCWWNDIRTSSPKSSAPLFKGTIFKRFKKEKSKEKELEKKKD